MRKAVIVGVALVCMCVAFAVNGPSAQRAVPEPYAPATKPSQVEVTNFPAVQAVSGSVNVANLPAVQTVGGSVAVSNLPVDADGNLRTSGTVSLAVARIHVVGVTAAMFSIHPYPRMLTLNRGCNAEFPGSRVCVLDEALAAIPPPPEWSGLVWMAYPPILNPDSASCYSSDGLNASCQLSQADPDTHPALCCGY